MEKIITFIYEAWVGLPSWLQAFPILLLGLVMAMLLRLLVSGVLTLVQFDKIGGRAGISEFLRKGKVNYTPSKLIGLFVFWLVLGVVVLKVVRLLDMELATDLSKRIQETIPGLIAASLLCVLGLVLVLFIGNLIGTIMSNAGFMHGDSIARVIKWLGGLVVLAIAMEQVSVGRTLLSPLIQIFFAALAFGVALAFGLGCKDLARDLAARTIAAMRERNRASKTDLEG